MKNLLYLAVATALFVGTFAQTCPSKETLMKEFEVCKVDVAGPEAKDASIMELWQEHGSCIVKCMMNKFGILNPDGMINKEYATTLAKDCKAVHTDLADKIEKAEQCMAQHADAIDPSKPKCSGYHELISCVMQHFRKGA